MKNYMYELLTKIYEDKGHKLNYIIDTDILTKEFVIKKAIESKDGNILYNVALFVKNLTKSDINKIAEAIIKIDDLNTLYEYAANIPNAPIDKIVNKVIETGEAKYIFRLSLCIKEKREYIKKLVNEIINLKEAEYIYLFTRDHCPNLDFGDIEKLETAIRNTKDIEYIYEFAKYIKRISIRRLAETIIESGNEEYIQKLKELENAPADIELMIERSKLKKVSVSEYMLLSQLNALIKLDQKENIEYNRDIYRKLFVDTDEEEKTIENQHKKRTLTKQGMCIKPQIPGIYTKNSK